MNNPAFGSSGTSKSFQQMQAERNMQENEWHLAMMRFTMPKLTLDEKISAFIKNAMAHARYKAARKLAGGEWPG